MYKAKLPINCLEVPFKVKHRRPADGGIWDMKKSAETRPKCGRSIYLKGKEACAAAVGKYTPLMKKLGCGLPGSGSNNGLRSGWQEPDLHHAMLYNLKKVKDQAETEKREKKQAEA